ncbi:hypothetical protein C0995_005304 [Termitomyces sp. Mi166|nr:hypothetical protein C0995_005304 [Termitomyces sp. Mi166\
MELLRQAPNLEYLELLNACQEVGENDIISLSKDDPVPLPRLQHISCAGDMCNVILLQTTHPTPPGNLTLEDSKQTERSTSALCATLVTRMSRTPFTTRIDYWATYHCTLSGRDSLSLDRPPSAVPILDLGIASERSGDLEGLLVCIIWDSVVGGIANLENLTTIRVGRDHAALITLIQAMKKTYFLKVDANGEQPSKHHVRSSFKLVIQKWYFDSSIVDKLMKCLAVRRRCGAKLQQLSVIEGRLAGSNPTDVIAKPRKNMKEVIWDVQIVIEQPQDEGKGDKDRQSVSSNEVESWDYSSPRGELPI